MVKHTGISKSIFIFLMLAFLAGISGCKKDSTNNKAAVSSVKNSVLPHPQGGVYYSLFVRSFADSDGDGTGDFDGITEQLDYLYDLGIRGLWLLPVFPSPSYHGYDVDDYYDVNPDYGTMQDFEELLAACHERGISVMLDITFNHSSSTNKWQILSPHLTQSSNSAPEFLAYRTFCLEFHCVLPVVFLYYKEELDLQFRYIRKLSP